MILVSSINIGFPSQVACFWLDHKQYVSQYKGGKAKSKLSSSSSLIHKKIYKCSRDAYATLDVRQNNCRDKTEK